ncbi:MAG: recombinase family protein [Oscillospiraceae bacterium]
MPSQTSGRFNDYANQQGYNIVGEYVDDGVSGVSFDRPGFQQMMGDITERKDQHGDCQRPLPARS